MTTDDPVAAAELFATKELDGRWYVLTSIEMPGDPIYKRDAFGIQYVVGHEDQAEVWEPLATFIVEHRALGLSDQKIVAPVSLADALVAEGWKRP